MESIESESKFRIDCSFEINKNKYSGLHDKDPIRSELWKFTFQTANNQFHLYQKYYGEGQNRKKYLKEFILT